MQFRMARTGWDGSADVTSSRLARRKPHASNSHKAHHFGLFGLQILQSQPRHRPLRFRKPADTVFKPFIARRFTAPSRILGRFLGSADCVPLLDAASLRNNGRQPRSRTKATRPAATSTMPASRGTRARRPWAHRAAAPGRSGRTLSHACQSLMTGCVSSVKSFSGMAGMDGRRERSSKRGASEVRGVV